MTTSKSKKIIMGVDPGLSGCVSIIDVSNPIPKLLDHHFPKSVKVGKGRRLDPKDTYEFARKWGGKVSHCYFEKVGAMPSQGVTSMFNFGYCTGGMMASVIAAGIPVTVVMPRAWKKSFDLIGKDKDAARQRALWTFPEEPVLNLKGKGQALADSLLLALHGASTTLELDGAVLLCSVNGGIDTKT